MKKAVIVALAVLNVVLLAWVLTIHSAPAHAQVPPRGKDFLQVSGKISRSAEAFYVLDATTRNLKGWYFTSDRKPVELRGRDLSKDFSRDGKE